MSDVVILGAGQGGLQAAASLREAGHAGAITLVGAEPGLPYQRPPLSKAYLKDGDESRLWLRPEAFFTERDIDYRNGAFAEAIDLAARTVALGDGGALRYDALVLATGARNRTLPVPGAELPGVLMLRSLADAAEIRAATGSARRAAVIGGGFIGLEFAAQARGLGLEVTVLEASPRVMARSVSPQTSAHFEALHRGWGVDLRLGAAAEAIVGGTRAEGVRLSGGEVVEADLVLVAVGVAPEDGLARAAGLACDPQGGVVVDASGRSSDPAVHALGDCAALVPRGASGRMRLESVQNAVDGARAVAAAIAGLPPPPEPVPWFWSDQADAKLQIAGLGAEAEEWEAQDRGGGRLAVLGFRGGRLACTETVNAPADHMSARRLLALPEPPTREAVSAAGGDLRALLKRAA
jgi:3-phenylpropionate/trans-cinnamate dioxygenase ferredoxin reductase subunit